MKQVSIYKKLNLLLKINDADEQIFKCDVDDSHTWYGVLYESVCIINTPTSQQEIEQSELCEIIGKDLFTEIKISKYTKAITELTCGDLKELQEMQFPCVICNSMVNSNCKSFTSACSLSEYRTIFNNSSIALGFVCKQCESDYLEK